LLQNALGLQQAILVCALFFLTAFVVSLGVNESRGVASAKAHAGE